MRILVVPKWYPWPDRPVLGSFCREQARALSAAHDVVVLASDAVPRPDFRVFSLSDGVEDGLRTIRVRYRRPALRAGAMAAQTAGMLSALRRLRGEGWNADVVHAHVYSAGPPALLLGALARAPVVITEHYTGFQRGLLTGSDRLAARVAFGRADLVAPVSEELAHHVRAIAPRARVRVVGNVVDTEVFHPGPPRRDGDGAPRLLTVAALAQKKGHEYLLDALAQLRVAGRAMTLDLVGDGNRRAGLEQSAAELGLDDVVTFHGELLKSDVAQLMREADLFVLPSLYENQPVVLLEAMASGLTSVGTAVGEIPRLAGFVCPPGDASALADAIARAVERPCDAAALAHRAHDEFGYEAFARRWSEIYAELAKRAGTTSSATTRATAAGR